jgi:cytochrome c oxidase subunit 3
MSATTHAPTKAQKDRMIHLGLWLFIISDSFVFGGLLITRFVLLGNSRPELSQALGLVVTAVLLVSSFFMNRAETQIKHGDVKAGTRNLGITLALGILFLIGVVGVEWPLAASHGVTASASQAGAVFYIMTGYHAFHVLTGVLFLGALWNNARRGIYGKERHFAIEGGAVYWHFIDVAWIFFYPALYLMGTVLH